MLPCSSMRMSFSFTAVPFNMVIELSLSELGRAQRLGALHHLPPALESVGEPFQVREGLRGRQFSCVMMSLVITGTAHHDELTRFIFCVGAKYWQVPLGKG